MSNEHLLITPAKKIDIWKKIVEKKISEGEQIIIILDTETTGGVMKKSNGSSVIEKEDHLYMGLRHRVVELGALVCYLDKATGMIEQLKDHEDKPIYFHEYINFMSEKEEKLNKYLSIREMPDGAWFVHGISMNFLAGKECLGQELELYKNVNYNVPLPKNHKKTLKLSRSAPNFEEIVESFTDVCGLNYNYEENPSNGRVTVIAHNFEFDAKFMNAEMENAGKPFLESLAIPMDSIVMAQGVFPKNYMESYKKGKIDEIRQRFIGKKTSEELIKKEIAKEIPKGLYSLDFLSFMLTDKGLMNLDGIDRTLHGAALDCEILRRVYQGILSSDEYRMSPNKLAYNKTSIEGTITKLNNKERPPICNNVRKIDSALLNRLKA